MKRKPNQPETDRLPPHAPEAEAAVIGSVLWAPERAAECLNELEERGVTPAWFYEPQNAVLCEFMLRMHQNGQPVDTVTLVTELQKNGALAQDGAPGSAYYICQLSDDVIPSNLAAYLDEVEERYRLRKLVQACTAATGQAYEGRTADEVLDEITRSVLKLAEESGAGGEQGIREILLEVINDMEDYHRGSAQMRGLSTGIEYLDKALCGIGGEHGNYFVLSGRPGTGKTSLATQIALHVALDHVWWDPILEEKDGKLVPVVEVIDNRERFKCNRRVGFPVGIFSLEMAAKPLVQRMLFQRADADLQRWRTGYKEGEGDRKLTLAINKIATPNNIFIDDTARCTIESLRARARRMHRQHGIKLFLIDYIQLIRAERRSGRVDRQQELSDISAEIQSLGKELNVPFIVLAQMNRDFEKDAAKRDPRLADLKDCGAIEQDADVVAFLYKPKMKEDEEEKYDNAMLQAFGQDWSKYPHRINLLIGKNRYGPSDKIVQLLFQGSSTQFLDYRAWLKMVGYDQPAMGEGSKYDREPSTEGLPPAPPQETQEEL